MGGEEGSAVKKLAQAPPPHWSMPPPTLVSLTELPQCCKTRAPTTPESKEQPLNVGTSLNSGETAPDAHRTPQHALTVPLKSWP